MTAADIEHASNAFGVEEFGTELGIGDFGLGRKYVR